MIYNAKDARILAEVTVLYNSKKYDAIKFITNNIQDFINIDAIKEAYINYNIDTRENLEVKVYSQLGSILREAKEEIESLAKQNSSYITYEKIMELYNENVEKIRN